MRNYANEYNQAQAVTGESKTLPAGGYVCRIVSAADVPEKEYLLINYDIAEGEQMGFFRAKAALSQAGKWSGRCYKSYKPAVMGYFKGFMQAVEASNPGFAWSWNEQALTGKLVGIVMREEEFVGQDGGVHVAVKPCYFVPVAKIRAGDFQIPQRKTIEAAAPAQQASPSAGFTPVDDDELPF